MAVISLLVPAAVQALFGDPPVLRGEEISVYYNILDRFAEIVDPQDTMEWLWIKDLTDHSWEIRRLRRFKILFVESSRNELHYHRQRVVDLFAKKIDDEYEDTFENVPVAVPDSEMDSCGLFEQLIDR